VRERQAVYLRTMRESRVLREFARGNETVAGLVVHGSHDALAVAGGLSVPGFISDVLWVLHNGTGLAESGLVPPIVLGGPSHARLASPGTLRRLVLELTRLQPKVTFVPMAYGEQRVLLSLEAALVDKQTWGDQPNQIRLDRRVDTDVRTGPYGTAWAHQANADGGHTARGCPGMGLSLAMIEAFVQAFVDEWDAWEVEGGAPYSKGCTLVRRRQPP
jgi:hypothetical protein